MTQYGPPFAHFLRNAARVVSSVTELARFGLLIRNYLLGDPLDRPVPPNQRVRVLFDPDPSEHHVRAAIEEVEREQLEWEPPSEKQRRQRSKGSF